MSSKKKTEQPEIEETTAAEAPQEAAPLETIEALALRHKTEAWLFAAAKHKHQWPVGRELSEVQFLAALESTRRHTAH